MTDTSHLLTSDEQRNEKPVWNKEGIMTVAGGVILMLVLGAFYLWGAIGIYITSHLRQYEPDLVINSTAVLFPLQGIMIAFGWPLGKTVNKYLGLRLTVSICMLIICLSWLVQSWIRSFTLFAFVYGVVIGLATGIVYFPPIFAGWKWLPLRKGSVTGFVVAGFAIGSFIFGIITTEIVNPDNIQPTIIGPDGNKYFDADVAGRVPMMLRILAASYFILAVISVFLLQDPDSKKKQDPDAINISDSENSKSAMVKEEMSLTDALKTKQMYMLTFMVFGSSIIGFFMASTYKVYGQKQPALQNDLYLSWVGSVANIWNGGSRVIWGYFLDRFSFKKVYGSLVVVEVIVACTLQFAGEFRWMYFIWVSILLCCEGGHFALFPTYTSKVYGPENGPKVYGLVGFGLSFGNIAQFLVTRYAVKDSYVVCFYAYSGMAIASFLVMLLFREKLTRPEK